MIRLMFRFAEASCSSVVRVARNVVQDIGESACSHTALADLANCSLGNAERDTRRLLVGRLKLSLPVKISKLGSSGYPIFKLRHWYEMLLARNCWHIVCGLKAPDDNRQKAILHSFWQHFKSICPDHPVYSRTDLPLDRTAPLIFHGDEGRGRRRSPFLICSYHGLLGRGIGVGVRSKKNREYIKHLPNFLGHTFTTYFMQAAYPKTVMQDEQVLQELLDDCVCEADYIFREGVANPHSGERHYGVVLANTGDWQWLHKSGFFNRSYNNVAKFAQEIANPRGICHMCLAGQRGFPFEELAVRDPKWLPTCFLTDAFTDPSPLMRLPHEPGRAAKLFQWDLWHSFHLGVGKSFTASSLALLSSVYDGRSKDARFEQLSVEYMAFCAAQHISPILTKITREVLNWETATNFPMGNWYKGAITTNLCDFIRSKTAGGGTGDEWLDLIGEASVAIHACIAGLYKAGVFLEPATARELGEQGLRFLRRYCSLAKKAVLDSRPLFSILPKHHCLHHVFLQDLLLASQTQPRILNPICWTVQQSEDYIGRGSRISRRVHPRTCARRVMERHLQLAYDKYVEAGYLVVEEGG